MFARQRQDLILALILRTGAARVSDLTVALGVSDMTVRRDLEVLVRQGLVDKVHGGATAPGSRSTDEPGFEVKSNRQVPEKADIARAAAVLVTPGSAVGLTAGTTTYAVAAALVTIPDLTVVTNSPRIADALDRHRRTNLTVVLTGGVRTPSDALVGPIAVSTLSSLHIDLLFMGVHGMDERGGFTTPNLLEAETNRAFIEAARRLVVVADHTKWGLQGLCTTVALDRADIVISDPGLGPEGADVLRTRVDRLILADGDDAVVGTTPLRSRARSSMTA